MVGHRIEEYAVLVEEDGFQFARIVARTEDRTTDSDHRTTAFDSELIIIAHAHGENLSFAKLLSLREAPSDLCLVVGVGGHGHKTLDADTMQIGSTKV